MLWLIHVMTFTRNESIDGKKSAQKKQKYCVLRFWKAEEHLLQSHAYESQAHVIRSAVNLSSYHRVTVGTHIFRGACFQSLNQIGMLNENPAGWLACSLQPHPFPHSYIWRQQQIFHDSWTSVSRWEEGLADESRDKLREVSKGGCRKREREKNGVRT